MYSLTEQSMSLIHHSPFTFAPTAVEFLWLSDALSWNHRKQDWERPLGTESEVP